MQTWPIITLLLATWLSISSGARLPVSKRQIPRLGDVGCYVGAAWLVHMLV